MLPQGLPGRRIPGNSPPIRSLFRRVRVFPCPVLCYSASYFRLFLHRITTQRKTLVSVSPLWIKGLLDVEGLAFRAPDNSLENWCLVYKP
jgi:hypothetical protein